MSAAVTVRADDRLEGAALDGVLRFLAAAPWASHEQHPDWPRFRPAARRHRYLHLRAFDGDALVAYALARLSPLAAGYRLAFLRRGPVTHRTGDLTRVIPAFQRALKARGVATLVLNPRWQDGDAETARAAIAGLGGRVLPPEQQSVHRLTPLVDLSGTGAELSARLKARGRRQIRQCERMGLVVSRVTSGEEAMAFAPVFDAFMRHRGLDAGAVPGVAEQWAMAEAGGAMFLGRYKGAVICGHTVVVEGDRAFWLTMAGRDTPRDMPRNAALVWQAMLWAQAQGLRWYDMAGAPATDAADSGAEGRQQFKAGFNPTLVALVPMMALPVRPLAHAVLFPARQLWRARRAAQGWRR